MNKEEVLAMEAGTDLDVLIAIRLFNGHIITKSSRLSDKTFYALIGGENREYQPLDKSRNLANVWWRHTEAEAWEACPAYSTDISAAWEVRDRMFEQPIPIRNKFIEETTTDIFHINPMMICKAALISLTEVTP